MSLRSKKDRHIQLSVVVITKNEEKNIEECLRSARWADELIVVDTGSTDRTVALAKKFTDKVYRQPWSGYGIARNFGVDKSKGDWIFWMDADERITPELAERIQEILRSPDAAVSAYEISRKAFFLGRWIKHCGWYPGWVTRLFKRDAARFTDTRVHERLLVEGRTRRIYVDVLHYTDPNLFHYLEKSNRYTSLAAEELFGGSEKFRMSKLLLNPFWVFVKMYFIRRGFLDGLEGFILCVLSAAYVFAKYAKLWEKYHTAEGVQ